LPLYNVIVEKGMQGLGLECKYMFTLRLKIEEYPKLKAFSYIPSFVKLAVDNEFKMQ